MNGGMNLHVRPRANIFRPQKIETTDWLHKLKNVSKTAMSVILEYEISQSTEKLPSMHDRCYRLEVYTMHTLTIWGSRIYLAYRKRLFESEDKCEAIDTKKKINSLANEGHYHTKVLHLAL